MKHTRVAICRNAAHPGRDRDMNERLPLMTDKLRKHISQRGVGLFASADARQSFLDSLSDIERKRWFEWIFTRRLAHVLEQGTVGPIDAQETLEALRDEYAELADVVVCAHEHERQLGLEYRDERPCARPEVASLSNLDRVSAFDYDEEDSRYEQSVPHGTDRETVWEEWFALPASQVSRLVLIDRYGLKNELKRKEEGAGFGWLLRQVLAQRSVPTPLKLEVVMESVASGAVSVKHLRQAIDALGLRHPSPASFRSITVWLADVKFAQMHLHDRLIQFDGRVLACGTGLQVFADAEVYQDTSIHFGSYRESERRLRHVEATCEGVRWRDTGQVWCHPPGEEMPVRFDDEGG